jgi:hypothetical protein
MENRLLDERNSGFKQNDSTVNRLIQITQNIYNNLDKNQDTTMVFLDISKAFDKVWHKGLLGKLNQIGITGELYTWFVSYLKDRRQKVIINGTSSDEATVMAGVPQGSILGPLLFLIYINDLSTDISSEISMFADDTAIYHSSQNVENSIQVINSDLVKIQNWSENWKVKFNAKKTYYMQFSLKTIVEPTTAVILNNQQIIKVENFKYLGVTLNCKMSWKNHIHQTINKALIKLYPLYQIKHFAPRDTLCRLYKCYVRPTLEYANTVFDNCSARETIALENVQRKAAILCASAYKHTSNAKLL